MHGCGSYCGFKDSRNTAWSEDKPKLLSTCSLVMSVSCYPCILLVILCNSCFLENVMATLLEENGVFGSHSNTHHFKQVHGHCIHIVYFCRHLSQSCTLYPSCTFWVWLYGYGYPLHGGKYVQRQLHEILMQIYLSMHSSTFILF